MVLKDFYNKVVPTWQVSDLSLATIGIGIFSAILLFSIIMVQTRRKLPPYNPDNMLETIKIFTRTKTPEYVLDSSSSVGSIFMCKLYLVLNCNIIIQK